MLCEYNVLDAGKVVLLDTMGSDTTIVESARISYGKGTRKTSTNRSLIRYLMRNDHTTPFEMCVARFFIKVPMDVWRQMIRHRTASVNEYSTRYSEAIESTLTTSPFQWRKQSHINKQGSEEGCIDEKRGSYLTARESMLLDYSRQVYNERLKEGVAREQARKDLPLSTYTEAYWQMDLHNLLHFLELRLAPNAQQEIRAVAKAISYAVQNWVPLTWEAFEDYKLESVTFSSLETRIIREFLYNYNMSDDDLTVLNTYVEDAVEDKIMTKREGSELLEKLHEHFDISTSTNYVSAN